MKKQHISTAGALILTSQLFAGCVLKNAASSPDVSDIPQSPVKAQSINNCWAYAAAAWIESLHLSATGQKIDVSESYLTYWHFHDQLVDFKTQNFLLEEGSFENARNLLLRHGYMLEGDFIPEEKDAAKSERQKKASAYMLTQLRPEGPLREIASRESPNVKRFLDNAFGVRMDALSSKIKSIDQLIVGHDGRHRITLRELLEQERYRWETVSFPAVSQNPALAAEVKQKQLAVIRRIQKALHKHQPVLLNLKIDSNAIDRETGTYSGELFRKRGPSGSAGTHLVVVKDYIVDNVPGVGTIGEGEVSPALKNKALEGKVRTFIVKNSWGLNPDIGSPDGYIRFDLDYLTESHHFRKSRGTQQQTPLFNAVLPPDLP